MFSTKRFEAVPNVSVSVNAERNVYNPTEILEIKIDPQQIPFADMKQSYLEFDLSLAGNVGRVKLHELAGGHALIKNIFVKNNQGVVLEEIKNYNLLQSWCENYKRNDSVDKQRTYTIGTEMSENENKFCLANFQAGALNLVYPTHKLCMPLNTGLLSSNKILPIASLRGLTIHIELEEAAKALVPQFSPNYSLCNEGDPWALGTTSAWSNVFAEQIQGNGGVATNITNFVVQFDDANQYPWTKTGRTGGDGTRTCDVGWNNAQAEANLIENSPYWDGMAVIITYSITDANTGNTTNHQDVRNITSYTLDTNLTDGNGNARYALKMNFAALSQQLPAAQNSSFTGNFVVRSADVANAMNYRISNPQLKLKKCLPPMDYVNEVDNMEKNNDFFPYYQLH